MILLCYQYIKLDLIAFDSIIYCVMKFCMIVFFFKIFHTDILSEYDMI